MDFRSETRLNEAVSPNPKAIGEDTGVDSCGGGSLHGGCLHTDVPRDEIVERLRRNSGLVRAQDADWVAAPLTTLTQHIRQHHHHYVREAIPRVRALLATAREEQGGNHCETEEMEKLFGDVAREMLMHMQKEEQILFPYIDALERSANGEGPLEPPFFQSVRNPIHTMMKEHDSVEGLVKQIRTTSRGYVVPDGVCASYHSACQELEAFEADLHEHLHLENNILFPRAAELEAAVV